MLLKKAPYLLGKGPFYDKNCAKKQSQKEVELGLKSITPTSFTKAGYRKPVHLLALGVLETVIEGGLNKVDIHQKWPDEPSWANELNKKVWLSQVNAKCKIADFLKFMT